MNAKYEGRITIGTTTSNMTDDYITINLKDKNSGLQVIEIQMSHEEFGKAIGGQGYIPARYNVYDNRHLLGKKKEGKLIQLKIPNTFDREKFEAEVDLAFARTPYAKEGWELRSGINMRDYNYQDGIYNASIYRYVFVEESE